jgi:hypothetical protein
MHAMWGHEASMAEHALVLPADVLEHLQDDDEGHSHLRSKGGDAITGC